MDELEDRSDVADDAAELRPRNPRRICLLDVDGEGSTAGTLLRDLAEALAVYARHDLPDAIPELVWAADEKDEPSQKPEEACDVLVIGFLTDEGALPEELGARLAQLRDAGMLTDDARAYALVVTDDHDGIQAENALWDLGYLCDEMGLVWCGGLAVGGGAMVLPTVRSPRMGWLRRSRSESIDHLIWYVLAGRPTPEGMRVRGTLPKFIYRRKYLKR